MKKAFQLLPILALVFSLSFVSCSSDDDGDDNPSKTTSEYLTSGSWKVSAMTIDPGLNFGGVVITDFFAQIPACTQDDLTNFQSDGTVVFDEGATKCNPNDPQTTSGTWTLASDNKTMTVKEPGEEDLVITISSINDTGMTGTFTMEEDFGAGMATYTITVSFVKG